MVKTFNNLNIITFKTINVEQTSIKPKSTHPSQVLIDTLSKIALWDDEMCLFPDAGIRARDVANKALSSYSERLEKSSVADHRNDSQKSISFKEMERGLWLQQFAQELMKEPYNWEPKDAWAYALSSDLFGYYKEGLSPANAVKQDAAHWSA